jgi:hypothetical protein
MADPLTPLTASETSAQELQTAHEHYVHRLLVGLDQFMDVVTDGDPDETISSRAARAAEKGKPWGVGLSKILNAFQSDHGVKAQAGDVERAEAVVASEEGSGYLSSPSPQ